MRKVVFLDRDGVINKERGDYTYKVADFSINDGVIKFLQYAQENSYEFIIITNQGGISKKIYNHNDVNHVHDFMLTKFQQAGIEILNIYYCPHHSEIENCICRKPKTLMLEKAIARFNIDIKNSILIGDNKRDIMAAETVGIKAYLIPSNYSLLKIINKISWIQKDI